MTWIPGATFSLGALPEDLALYPEAVPHQVKVDGFFMDTYEVTNAQFKKFVDATGHITTAEKQPDWELIKQQSPPGTPKPPDSLFQPGSIVYFNPSEIEGYENYLQWWSYIPGANWKHPTGPESNLDGLWHHPVVHVSWWDAQAYADWAGKDLPTEAEWELAAGKKLNLTYAWGNDIPNPEIPQANFFQGTFPTKNLITDQHERTAPVGAFAPNEFGLHDMAGNVWEWTQDYFHQDYYKECATKGIVENPMGPASSFDPNEPLVPKRITKGGSFLCNDSYCSGYKTSRRMRTDPYSSFDHTGFRCVKRK